MHVSFILRVYQYLIVPGFFRTLLLPPQTKLRPTTLSPPAVLTATASRTRITEDARWRCRRFPILLLTVSTGRPPTPSTWAMKKLQPAVAEMLESRGLKPEFQQHNEGCIELKPANLEAYARR